MDEIASRFNESKHKAVIYFAGKEYHKTQTLSYTHKIHRENQRVSQLQISLMALSASSSSSSLLRSSFTSHELKGKCSFSFLLMFFFFLRFLLLNNLGSHEPKSLFYIFSFFFVFLSGFIYIYIYITKKKIAINWINSLGKNKCSFFH